MKHLFSYQTNGEKFYSITQELQQYITQHILKPADSSGILTIFVPHTSCALCINEDYAPSARADMETFLQKIAPRNAAFITHTEEGDDDSPSHMKALLLQHSLTVIVENGKIDLGEWQGIFLAEFRDGPKNRKLWLHFRAD